MAQCHLGLGTTADSTYILLGMMRETNRKKNETVKGGRGKAGGDPYLE